MVLKNIVIAMEITMKDWLVRIFMKNRAVFVLIMGTILTFPVHGQQRLEKGQGHFQETRHIVKMTFPIPSKV